MKVYNSANPLPQFNINYKEQQVLRADNFPFHAELLAT
jgi:hypothetical protein